MTCGYRATAGGVGWEYDHVCIDDASRIAFAKVMSSEKKRSALAFLNAALAYYQSLGVKVERVMTDNGSFYKSFAFRRACKRLGLRHIHTKPYTPRTNGKAERFIQTSSVSGPMPRPTRIRLLFAGERAAGQPAALNRLSSLSRRRIAGVPVVAGPSSGIRVIALRSYLNPFAVLSASLVAFITRYHLLLSLVVTCTALKGTATSFSPIPRKPPTPTMSAVTLPSRSTSTSLISPILLSPGS